MDLTWSEFEKVDMSAIEPKFFSNLARRRSTCKRSFLDKMKKDGTFM